MEKNEDLSDQWFSNLVKRLKVMTSKVDVLAGDMLYHQLCYVRFAYSYEDKNTTKTEIYALSVEK